MIALRSRPSPLRRLSLQPLTILLIVAARVSAALWALPADGQTAISGGNTAQSLVRGVVDETDLVTLHGGLHPIVRVGTDLGAVEDAFPMSRLYLLLKRPDAQERALQEFLREAHTPGSAQYHKWLTPQDFGARFGAADSDIAVVTAWLESRGFTVNKVHPGRIAIEFSGNAAQVRAAFHTEIHRYAASLRGQSVTDYANAAEVQIPAALAALVEGLAPMNSWHAKPLVRVAGATRYDPKTHEAVPILGTTWTYPLGGNSWTYELSPADFAVQYDLGPVYQAGTTGTGESIGIMSASNVDLSLVAAYQSLFHLPANLPSVVVDGNDPGQTDAATEAYLDLEEAGAVAPGANVVMYTSGGSVLTDPLLSAALRALEDNVVSVMSVSYGACEAELGAAGNAAWNALWEEAAAQGITGFVATGDAGSAGCDDFESQEFAEGGLAVNGLASTPYNVAVGGTDFYYSDYAAGGSALEGQIGSYWNMASSASPVVSLLQAAPEQAWNDPFGLNAVDAGVYDAANPTIVAGGGGVSNAAVYAASGVAGYPKPGWQAGSGVPADRVRDLPDVALFAGNGANYVEYPICAEPGDCVNTASGGAVVVTSVGGTSAAAPAMAAIQALVNQTTKSRQGQANYVYYALAGKTLAGNALAAKPFRDITTGGNEVPCLQATLNCVLSASGQAKGNYAESGYAAASGYDLASGLGSVDVANLIASWGVVSFTPTNTTLSISPAVLVHGTPVTVNATVAPASGSGTATGSVVLNSTDPIAGSNSLAMMMLTNGAAEASVNTLPGGTYQVVGEYSGDGSFAASASEPVLVTVTPENDTLETSGWVLNPVDGNLYPLDAGMSIPYGAQVYLDAQPVGVNAVNLTPGKSTPATGAVTFTDKAGAMTKTTTVALNGAGVAEWDPALAVGNHTLSASYSGDASYNASTAPTAATLSVFKGTTTISLQPMEPVVIAGSSVTVDVLLYADYLPLTGSLPTGTIVVTLGSQSQTVSAPFKSWTDGSGARSGAIQEVVVTFANVPLGILPLSATYSGDANWNGSSGLYGSVASLATRSAPVVTMTASAAAYLPNQVVALSGTVTGTAAFGAPRGSVAITWADGGHSLSAALQAGTGASSTFSLSFPAWQLANGANALIAAFAGDANYSAQSSGPVMVMLNGSDFSLTTTTPKVDVVPGKTATGTVMVAPLNGFGGAVSMACSAPLGITCTPSATSVLLGGAASDSIAFGAVGTVAAGTYAATVTATGSGHTHTAQILVAYTPPAAAPAFSPAAGTFTTAQTVTMSDATTSATIYYTTDGSTPNASSAVYSGPVAVRSTETLRAVAIAQNYSLSAVTAGGYTITTAAATPVFSPASGTYASAQTVTISDVTPGAAIHYTTNGSVPTASSAVYSGPITVAATETISAIAMATGYATSGVATAIYTINASTQQAPTPTFNPGGGTYYAQQTVTISDAMQGAAIYYTADGSTPTMKSNRYTAPVLMSGSGRLQAIAIAANGPTSKVASAQYTMIAATPVIGPPSSTQTSPIKVTITTATPTAKIYFTTNGSVPTTSSTLYRGPFTVLASETVKAIAAESGFTQSPVVATAYVIETPILKPPFPPDPGHPGTAMKP